MYWRLDALKYISLIQLMYAKQKKNVSIVSIIMNALDKYSTELNPY